jgi:hypothetical protein
LHHTKNRQKRKWQDATGAFFCQICDETRPAEGEAGGISRSNMDFDVHPRGENLLDIVTRAFDRRDRGMYQSNRLRFTIARPHVERGRKNNKFE